MMPVSNELTRLGVIRKEIDREVDPSKPIHWSKHAWNFGDEDENAGKVTLRLHKLVQNGRTILHSSMTLGAIDALAGVPAFHPGISNVEAAGLALFPPKILSYQRALIVERIPGIKSEFSRNDFSHTGTITIHVPPEHLENEVITVADEGDTVLLTINLKDILKKVDEEYVDVDSTGTRDHRPLHVVDGMHRKVSCEEDLFLQNFPVFINILPLGSTYGDAAQLFTELNVTAEPLKPLHQLYQRYTCFIPHREPGKDYGDPDDPNVPAIRARYRRANRRAFELAMKCAFLPYSPLYERVQTMELPNRKLGRGCSITSKKFVEFARSWFLDDRVFQNMPDDEVQSVFFAYLRAWRRTVNLDHEGEPTEFEAWNLQHERGVAEPFITRPLPFASIMSLFPMVYDYSRQQELGSDRERFIEVLTPLSAVAFDDYDTLHTHYGLTEETPKALHAWFSWAITNYMQTGQTYDVAEVWNPETKEAALCKPGRGFFSKPNRETIEGVIEWDDDGLISGTEMRVWMRPYPNTHKKPIMVIKYLNGEGEVIESATGLSRAADQGHALLKHKLMPSIHEAEQLQVQIILQNLHGEAQVQATFDLEQLNLLDDSSLDIGAPCSVPREWRPTIQTTDVTEDEEGEEDVEDEPEEESEAFTVVRVDEEYIIPPPEPNKLRSLSVDMKRMPRASRISYCMRCSHGLDCSNAQCVGHTIDGYVWGY